MTSDDTLKRYVIITPHLRTRPVESRMLPAEVEKLTAGALVFEHSTTDTAAPDEAETRRRAGLRQTSRLSIIKSNSRSFSVVLPDRVADANLILRNAASFPEYSIRPIRRDLPTSESTEDPTIFANSSLGRLTEVGEVQWYLKAMLHRECEAKEGEESIMLKIDQAHSKNGGKPCRRQLKGKKKRTSTIHHTTGYEFNFYFGANPSGLHGGSPAANSARPVQPPLAPAPVPHPTPATSVPPALAPHTVLGDPDLDELQLAKYQVRIALCNIAYRDVLAVMLEGAPILESIQAPESTPTHVEYPSVFWDMPINPVLARSFKRITQLRRNVVDPTNPKVVEFDRRFMNAIFHARNRILRGE